MSSPSQQLDQLTEKYNPLLILLQNRFFLYISYKVKSHFDLTIDFWFFFFCIIYLFIYLRV